MCVIVVVVDEGELDLLCGSDCFCLVIWVIGWGIVEIVGIILVLMLGVGVVELIVFVSVVLFWVGLFDVLIVVGDDFGDLVLVGVVVIGVCRGVWVVVVVLYEGLLWDSMVGCVVVLELWLWVFDEFGLFWYLVVGLVVL